MMYGKEAYNKFIKELDWKPGDFAIRVGLATFPILAEDVWKVTQIQEIWYMCKDHETTKPCPIGIKNREDEIQWVHPDDLIRIQIPKLEF